MAIKNKKFLPDGPIPGENYTSDTRNYPWHRPPEITDMDTAIEKMMKKLSERDTAYSLLTVLQAGIPVVTAADIFLTNAIGSGKLTPDMALLLAGPTTHIMKLMADEYGIEYDMGLDDQRPPTIAFLKAKSDIDPSKVVNIVDDVSAQIEAYKPEMAQRAKMGGFASMEAPQDSGNPEDMSEGPDHESMPMDPQEDMSEGENS